MSTAVLDFGKGSGILIPNCMECMRCRQRGGGRVGECLVMCHNGNPCPSNEEDRDGWNASGLCGLG